MKSGQAEIIIIVGILVVVVSVVYFSVQLLSSEPAITTGIENQKRLAENSIKTVIREATLSTLDEISVRGGYPEAQPNSVLLDDKEVPYWSYRGQVNIPNVKANMETGIRNFLAQSKETIISGSTQTLTIEDPSVSVNIIKNKIIVDVNMPSTLWIEEKPYTLDRFSVDVPSRLGQTLSFSQSFVSKAQTERYLETFTMASILISPFDGPTRTVPFYVLLTECGDNVYKTWYDIKPEMESIIKATLANTYMPDKYPTGVIRTSSSPKYVIPDVDSNDYQELDIAFHLPDDFELNPASFQMTPNIISIYAAPIPYTAICQSEPFVVDYIVNYPAVVRIKDDLTGTAFQYAIDVFIRDNKPAPWSATQYDLSEQEIVCSNPQCEADLIVRDSNGIVKGAAVTFMGCPLGQTDILGKLQGVAPCGAGSLEIDAAGHSRYDQIKSTQNALQQNELETTITLRNKPVMKINFYDVDVISQLDGSYFVPFGGIEKTQDFVQVEFAPIDVDEQYSPIFTEASSLIVSNIPEGNYYIAAIISDDRGIIGSFGADYTITNDDQLYMYIPKFIGLADLDGEPRLRKIHELTNVMINCGIGPIRASEFQQTQACVTSV